MSLKILLADDSMTAQNMGKKILTDAGFDVLAVSNGAAAIKKIASDRPDIIILDVYMPGYTGLEVCERVKGASETSRIPVLLTVGKMEPFKPEEANRVRADGVMIKPFEATDLIAAIRGIANKTPDSTSTSSPAATMPAPPPPFRPAAVAPKEHESVSEQHLPEEYEQTVRLTPEQIREFQEQASRGTSSPVEEKPVTENVPEAPVVSAVQPKPAEADTTELVISPASILEPVQSPAEAADFEPAMPVVPGLDSSEAPIARAMAGVTGHDFFTVTPTHAVEEGAASDSAISETPAFFNAEPRTFGEPESVFKFRRPESHVAPFEASVDIPIAPEPASGPVESASAPSGFFVPQSAEFEPNVAPAVEVSATEAPGLEINSPIHAQPEVEVSTDPGLVTEAEDLSQFTTKFGKDGAEDVHVGVVMDLPPEQLAAITAPAEATTSDIVQEVPELETPETVYPPIMAALVEEADETVTEIPAVDPPVVEPPTNVLDEVGTIPSEGVLAGTGPVVAYVPALVDTQPLSPYVSSEPEPVSAPVVPEFVVPTEPVEAVASEEGEQKDLHVAEPEYAAPVMEAAAAAAAGLGGGFVSEVAHFFTSAEPVLEPAVEAPAPVEVSEPVVHEAIVESPTEAQVETATDEPIPQPMEPLPAAAEEIEQALTDSQLEEVTRVAAMAAISVTPESSTATENHSISDNKVSEAVSHAFEKLRPQLIAEILKELTK